MSAWSDMSPEQKAVKLARSAAWRKANPDKIRAKDSRWRKANPDKVRAQEARRDKTKRAEKNAIWRKKNAVKDSERKAAWYAKNADKERKRMAQWSKEHKGEAAAHAAKRRAHKLAQTPPLTPYEQADIIALYAKARALTELIGEPYHVDHIKPLSKGGLHHPDNLQVLLGVDNLKKGAKLL